MKLKMKNFRLSYKCCKRLTIGIITLILGVIGFPLIATQNGIAQFSSVQASPLKNSCSPQPIAVYPPDVFTPDTIYDPNDAYYVALLNSFKKYPKDKAMFVLLFTNAKDALQTKPVDMLKINAMLNQTPAYMSVLDMMRCIPYARVGYKFKRPITERVFQCFSWYRPSQSNAQTVEKHLTSMEKSNIAAIVAFEKQHWSTR